jgi:hypothetical protein
MFTIKKPDGSLRSLADLRELNKRIKRKPFPLPKINDMLQRLEGFFLATSLDLNMGYYHTVELTPNSSRLCTIVLPWGKYEYLRLPMGLCNSPNIFQEKMSELMVGLDFARAYIDDLLVVSKGNFATHLEHLEQVFTRLAEAGLKVNATKSHFCRDKLEYLGYLINRKGVCPTLKKVEAITNMPNYVPKALLTLRHPKPARSQHAPHLWTAPAFGTKIQLASTNLSPLLHKSARYPTAQRVQQISGLFLYYSCGCDPTIITAALNKISNHQAAPTEKNKAACNMLLDYLLATHPDAAIHYHASNMVLAVCSDAAYLVLPNARSCAAGHFFLTTLPSAISSPPNPTPNGAIHDVLCKTLCSVAASASEAKIGALFLNAQDTVPIRTALEEMGHKQPLTGTPLETNNSTAAHGILHAQVCLKKSKAFDMRYHWLKDRVLAQNQFNLYWAPGKTNRADYYSKHHPPAHHKLIRYQYLQRLAHTASIMSSVRGCVSPSGSSPPGLLSTDDVTSTRSRISHHSISLIY